MNQSPQFRAKPYIESDKSNQERAKQLALVEETIMVRLTHLGAPFITPVEIAPMLGIVPDSVRYHCRNCRAIKNWKTGWKFFLDDPEHVVALRAVVHLVVWSVKSLPEDLRPKIH